jgi:hypothetical protein
MIHRIPPVRSLAIMVCLSSVAAAGGGGAMVELASSETTWQGRSLAHDQRSCWLLDRTGALHDVPLKYVTSYRIMEQPFRAETVVEARDRLSRLAPEGMEVAARGRYVVLGPKGAADDYAELMQQVCDEFRSHFTKRQFDLVQPEFPLVVIVFPTQEQFAAYTLKDGAGYSANLKGYYSRATNWIATYAETAGRAAVPSPGASAGSLAFAALPYSADILGSVDGNLRSTLIHEATHQLAYNTNLHSRIGDHPRWMSEGLAMLFEEDSRRDDSLGRDPTARLNRSRYIWFMNYRQNRRPKKSLRDFISSDTLFETSALDAYAEAWALSFYLVETRRSDYRRYLQMVAARNPQAPYTPEERLADFQTAFGKDVEYLEGQYLQFHDKFDLR